MRVSGKSHRIQFSRLLIISIHGAKRSNSTDSPATGIDSQPTTSSYEGARQAVRKNWRQTSSMCGSSEFGAKILEIFLAKLAVILTSPGFGGGGGGPTSVHSTGTA